MKLSVKYDFLPRQHSTNAAIIMDHFGLDFEQGQHVIADNLDVPIQPGNVVCWTGASGSGKSSLMRAAAEQLDDVINIDELELGSRLLIDSMPCGVDESLQILASCGLSEAQLMLRTPAELSDGQRYRFRLALAMSHKPKWILADEFTATLDRTLAKIIAFNIRRVSQRTGIGFLLATTHDDVLGDLSPDVHVLCDVDGEIEVNTGCHAPRLRGHAIKCGGRNAERGSTGKASGTHNRKKKGSASQTNSGSAKRPEPTGRTSLGGITAAITSASRSSP